MPAFLLNKKKEIKDVENAFDGLSVEGLSVYYAKKHVGSFDSNILFIDDDKANKPIVEAFRHRNDLCKEIGG